MTTPLRALRAQSGAAESQQGGVRRDAAGGKRAPLRAADLRPLRSAHVGAVQPQRPCGSLRLLAHAELLWRAVLSIVEGRAARCLGLGPRSGSAEAGGDRGESSARREPRGRARGARSALAPETGARRLRGRTRAPAICRRGAREPAGGALARTRLGGGLDGTGSFRGGLRTRQARAQGGPVRRRAGRDPRSVAGSAGSLARRNHDAARVSNRVQPRPLFATPAH